MRKHTAGDRVVQPQYGPGTVVEINERHTVIDFDEHGVHRFVTTLVALESTEQPAPPRRTQARARRAAPRA